MNHSYCRIKSNEDSAVADRVRKIFGIRWSSDMVCAKIQYYNDRFSYIHDFANKAFTTLEELTTSPVGVNVNDPITWSDLINKLKEVVPEIEEPVNSGAKQTQLVLSLASELKKIRPDATNYTVQDYINAFKAVASKDFLGNNIEGKTSINETQEEADARKARNIERYNEIAKTLVEYERRQEEARRNKAKRGSILQDMLKAWASLKKSSSIKLRNSAISLLCDEFENVLERYKKSTGKSANKIIRGYYEKKVDEQGNTHKTRLAGEQALFNEVYDLVQIRASQELQKGNEKYYRNLNHVLQNWESYVLLAKSRLSIENGYNLQYHSAFKGARTALDILQEEELAQEEALEESKKDPLGLKDYAESSSYSRLSARIKKLLSRIPVYERELGEDGIWHYKYDNNDNPVPKLDEFGRQVYANPQAMHNFLIERFKHVSSPQDIVARLEKLVKSSNNALMLELKPLYDVLSGIPQNFSPSLFPNEKARQKCIQDYKLLQDFYLKYSTVEQHYYGITEKLRNINGRNHKIFRTLLLNDVGNPLESAYKTILETNSSTPYTIFNDKGEIRISRLNALNDAIEYFRGPDGLNASSVKSKFFDNRNEAIKTVQTIVRLLGVPNKYFNSKVASYLLTNLSGKFANALAHVSYEVISACKAEGSSKKFNFYYNYKLSGSSEFSGFYKISDCIIKAINDRSPFSGVRVEHKAHTKNAKGQRITLFGNIFGGYMSNLFNDLASFRENLDSNGARRYIEKRFGHQGYLMNKDDDKRNAKRKFRIAWLNDLYQDADSLDIQASNSSVYTYWKQLGPIGRLLDKQSNNTPFADFSKKDHLKAVIAHFYKYKRINSKSKIADYPVFICGDANQFRTVVAPIYSKPDLFENLLQMLNLELDLIASMGNVAERQSEELREKGNATGSVVKFESNQFLLFPEFNKIFQSKEDESLSAKEKFEKMKERISLMTDNEKLEKIQAYYDINSSDNLYDDTYGFNKYIKLLVQYDVVKYVPIKDSGEYRLIPSSGFRDIFGKNEDVYSEKAEKKLRDELFEFYLNQKYATAAQMALMTVSPAFYSNLADLQKRYKETYSSGQRLDLGAVDDNGVKVFEGHENQKTIYIHETSRNAEDFDPLFMDVSRKKNPNAYNSYKEIDTTDGQAYRIIESYRRVALGLGQWNDDQEAFYQKLLEIRGRHTDDQGYHIEDITEDEIKELTEYHVVLMPFKPFLFTHEAYHGTHIPVQVKCSETVLIPELLVPDSQLRDLSLYMTNNDIDCAAMTSAIKVGNWGEADIAEAKDKDSLYDILSTAVVHDLSYKDYVIQVNVPPHEQDMRLFATQIRKLITSGSYSDVNHYFDDETNVATITGEDGKPVTVELTEETIKALYNELISCNFLESLKEYLADIKDADRIAEMLVESMLKNNKGTFDNLIAYITEEKNNSRRFTMPLSDPLVAHDTATDLIALFKNTVLRQVILGGTAVQATSIGLQGYEESKNLHMITNHEYLKNTDGTYKRDEDGNFIPDMENSGDNVLYAEVEIPLMQQYTDANGETHDIDYYKYCNTDGSLKYDEDQYEEWNGKKVLKFDAKPLIDIDFPGIRDFVAYRIPTERAYSILNCKAVRFSHPQSGITIRVPAQGVAISGFDFDIDKLFLMFKSFTENKGYDESKGGERWSKYDFAKSVHENEKSLRDNTLLEIIKHRLMDPATIEERTTPGGFPTATNTAYDHIFLADEEYRKAVAEKLKKNPSDTAETGFLEIIKEERKKIQQEYPNAFEGKGDYTETETLLDLNERNQIADKLIGIFANHNSNHAFLSGCAKMVLKKPISFGKHYISGLSDFLHSKGANPSLTLAEFLAASVDAVKKPVLGYMNLNIHTAAAACLLARIGYDMDDIGLLLNQPVIKHLTEQASLNNSSLTTALKNYKLLLEKEGRSFEEFPAPSQNVLVENIVLDVDIKSDTQIGIAYLFEEILQAANDLNFIVSNSKFTAANSISPSFGNYYTTSSGINNFNNLNNISIQVTSGQDALINNTLEVDPENIFEFLSKVAGNPVSYEQTMYSCYKCAMGELLKYYPYDKTCFKDIREFLLSKVSRVNDKMIELLHQEIPLFFMSIAKNGKLNPETPVGAVLSQEDADILMNMSHIKIDPDMSYSDFLMYVFPEIFKTYYKEMTSEENKSSLADELESFFMYLNITKDDNGPYEGITTIKMPFAKTVDEKASKDEIVDAIERIWRSDEKGRVLIENLFFYSLTKHGFNYAPSSFTNMFPTKLKEKISIFAGDDYSYKEFMDDFIYNPEKYNVSSEQVVEFFKQFICNHLDNTNLVTTFYGATEEELEDVFSFREPNGDIEFKDVVTISFNKDEVSKFIATPHTDNEGNTTGAYDFIPCICLNQGFDSEPVYYILDNISTTGTHIAIYRKVTPLGKTNVNNLYCSTLESALRENEERTKLLEEHEDLVRVQETLPEEAPTEEIPVGESSADDSNGGEEAPTGQGLTRKYVAEEIFEKLTSFIETTASALKHGGYVDDFTVGEVNARYLAQLILNIQTGRHLGSGHSENEFVYYINQLKKIITYIANDPDLSNSQKLKEDVSRIISEIEEYGYTVFDEEGNERPICN